MSPKEEFIDLIKYMAGVAWEKRTLADHYRYLANERKGQDKRNALTWAKEIDREKELIIDMLKNTTMTFRRIEWKS